MLQDAAADPHGQGKVSAAASVQSPYIAQINPTGLSDIPAAEDLIGFRPYTRALAWFLLNEKTKAPLTLSVEGPWGSGKSSFMLQLRKQLENEHIGGARKFFIQFNAWRNDKDEALWAAFAISCIRQLKVQIPFTTRVCGNIRLLWSRFDVSEGWIDLLKVAATALFLIGLAIYAFERPELITKPDLSSLLIAPWLAAAIAAVYYSYDKTKALFGNPLTYDLSKYVRNPKYEDKVAFIERFQADFANIVNSYVGEKGRVFIFVDDLDRCEVPRSAELLQAINLLLSADHGSLFFVLGLDREMVAAGIAAKNEKVLPYIAAGHSINPGEKLDIYRTGIEYGYSFMEKFVQVPFHVPLPDEGNIRRWVSELTEEHDENESSSAARPTTSDELGIISGADPRDLDQVVRTIAKTFAFNPRRLKQFVNILRLRVLIALFTGIFVPARTESPASLAVTGITLQQLGTFTAMLMRWPRLIGDLLERPKLFDELLSVSGGQAPNILNSWSNNAELLKAIDFDPKFSLRGVDLRPLLMTMPDVSPTKPLNGRTEKGRTQLISGLAKTISTSELGMAKTNPTEVSSSVLPGATGATGPTGSTAPSSA